jgi:hypothetical protein
MDIDRLYFIPLDKLQNPKNGECIVNAYWLVHKERGAVFQKRREEWGKIPKNFSSCAPLANSSEDIVKHTWETVYRSDPNYEVTQIPVAYLGYYG